MTDARLVEHLRGWLGGWPPVGRVTVIGSRARDRPGWDGLLAPLVGVGSGSGTVLSVPPWAVERVRALDLVLPAGGQDDDAVAALAEVLGRPGAVLGRGVFRWSTRPAALPDAGVWVARDAPRVPAWLWPFNGDVLVALAGDAWQAGVGLKRHDDAGRELAVVTHPEARGRGLARALVAQAARRVVAEGAVPTYLHEPDNVGSARVADAAGFPDRGWSVYGLFGPAAAATAPATGGAD